jgi:ABC-type dipeptide/oligopeptide/nickel transport system permease subunit
VGRDVLSRTIFSLRTNLIITAASVATGSLIIGVTLGLVAGYLGGKMDTLIMRVGEVFLAFPGLLLVILLAATVKPRVLDWVRSFEDTTGIDGLVQWGVADYLVIFGALAAFSWVGVARLVRGQVISLKSTAFIEATRVIGASTWRVMFHHLLPNALPPVIVVVTMGMGAIAGAEVVLSWLGIGIQPPVPSLGSMIREGQDVSILRNAPHLILPPIIVVGLLIFAWNLLGDALNDVLNPRRQG